MFGWAGKPVRVRFLMRHAARDYPRDGVQVGRSPSHEGTLEQGVKETINAARIENGLDPI